MAAHIGQPAPSRRFIKVYLLTWGLLALGALGYLAILTFPPPAGSPLQTVVAPAPRVVVSESKAVAEVRGSLSEIRKDVTELKVSVGERVENEKIVKTRLTALEERVSSIDATPPPSAADGAKVTDGSKPASKDGEPPAADAPAKVKVETGPTPPVTPPVVPIETGSIAAKEEAKEEIVFGEPVVTRGGKEFAVQVAAAASLSALKHSWGQLAERHAGMLGHLRPRVVGPRGQGGSYRLLAGPLATKADAERICSKLGIGPKACIPTPYTGVPL